MKIASTSVIIAATLASSSIAVAAKQKTTDDEKGSDTNVKLGRQLRRMMGKVWIIPCPMPQRSFPFPFSVSSLLNFVVK